MAYSSLDLTNATIAKWVRGGFIDNISARVPLFNWLRTKGCFEYWDGSGRYINEPVINVLTANNTQALDPYEEISMAPKVNTQLVPFTRKVLVFPVVVSYEELDANQGREKIIDLVKTKMTAAELSFASDLETMLFGDGTGQSGKEMLGLSAVIPNTSNRCPTGSGAQTAQAFDNLRAKMSNLTNTLTYGTVRPELYITDQTVYEGYETLCYGKYMPTDKSSAIDLGFSGDLVFRGKPVVFGDKVTASKMYFLNSTALKFRVKGLKSKMDSPFTVSGPYDLMPYQRAKAWVIEVAGALTCNMFRQLGALYSIS